MKKQAKMRQEDLILFKFAMAKKFLSCIPSADVAKTNESELEANVEGFLFFSSSIIDIIKREINERFHIFDKKNVFYIHGLRKHLSDSGRQGRIKRMIGNYFTTPSFEGSSVDEQKSSLWKLQSLRNQAMHGRVIRIVGSKPRFTYTVRMCNGSYRFNESTEEPRLYFTHMYNSLVDFVNGTRGRREGDPRHIGKIKYRQR